MRFEDENVWLTQKLIAELFECSIDNVSLHLKNIFAEGELDPKSVVEEYSITAADGKQYKTKHYNLEAIIAVDTVSIQFVAAVSSMGNGTTQGVHDQRLYHG